MPRILLAALALACVCSPAMAAECAPIPSTASEWGWYLGFSFVTLTLLGVMIARDYRRAERERRMWADYLRCWPACMACGLAVILPLGAGPALAAEVATVGDTAVILPWGQWVTAIAQTALYALLPILVALLGDAIRKVAPWAALFLTQARLQQMVTAVTDYALNAVEGAAKGKTLSVPVGSAVIAAGIQYAIENVPARVIAAAGGPEGIARLIFRQLHLEDAADEGNVLIPGLARAGVPAA